MFVILIGFLLTVHEPCDASLANARPPPPLIITPNSKQDAIRGHQFI